MANDADSAKYRDRATLDQRHKYTPGLSSLVSKISIPEDVQWREICAT